jgi:hypothetical protein
MCSEELNVWIEVFQKWNYEAPSLLTLLNVEQVLMKTPLVVRRGYAGGRLVRLLNELNGVNF